MDRSDEKRLPEKWRRTKIVATLGPACDREPILKELIQSGLDVVRLNMSHGTIAEHRNRITQVRRTSTTMGTNVAVLADLCGPKMRIGKISGKAIHLHKDDTFIITTRDVPGDRERVSCGYKNLPRDVAVGDPIFLADGLIQLRVDRVEGEDVVCTVLNPGLLTSGKGINLPGTRISAPSITEKDRKDLKGILKNGVVDYVALSFVRSPDDVTELKKLIAAEGSDARVIAKIEKPEGVSRLSEILEVTDAIMVARGDLGVETSVESMPVLQKRILYQANRAGVPAITATQMLETMTLNPTPTRAEANDVANAILDGTDAVMLSGETAVGKYPVEAVRTMARIAEVTEPQIHLWQDRRTRDTPVPCERDAIAMAATQTAVRIGARAICVFTRSGSSAQAISRYRPDVPVVALTPEENVVRQLKLCWGIFPHLCPVVRDFESMLRVVRDTLLGRVGLVPQDLICLVAGIPVGNMGETNTLYVMRLDDSSTPRRQSD